MSQVFGLDRSGNNNHWAVNNMAFADQVVDSPTNNFATLNSIWKDSDVGLAEGNLKLWKTGNMTRPALSTIELGSTGKWYCEVYDLTGGSLYAGVQWTGTDVETHSHNSGTYGYVVNKNGGWYANGSYTGSGGGSVTSGVQIRMLAYDANTGKMWSGANGSWNGDPAAGSGELLTVPSGYRDNMYFVGAEENTSITNGGIFNFGQDSSFAGAKTAQGNQDGNDIGDFYYTPPSGFLALCTSNLPDVTEGLWDSGVNKHFNTVAWTGDGTDDRSITGVGFQPDFTWIKGRNTTEWHHVYDSVRGANKGIYPNSLYQEESLSDTFESFDSDGFTVGYNASYSSVFGNKASTNYLAWNWKAGTSVSGSSSGSGTTQSYTGSVNTDAGFSIIRYTGNGTDGMQVPHHLGVVPDVILIKSLTSQAWNIFFPNALGADKGMQINNTGVAGGPYYSTHLSDTMPTTSLVTLGNGAATNTYADGVGQTYIMYCWGNKYGYSKAGSYIGNQDADGTFIYTGFKPAFVLISNTVTDGEGYVIMNNQSDPINVVGTYITVYPGTLSEQGTAATASSRSIDFLSNGFKLRGNSTEINENDDKHVYLAFAETPFKYANAG